MLGNSRFTPVLVITEQGGNPEGNKCTVVQVKVIKAWECMYKERELTLFREVLAWCSLT